MFVPAKPSKPNLMFVGKARSLPQRATPDKMFHLGRLQPHSRTFIQLEKLAKDKHSSLLQKFVNYGQKKFYNIGPSYTPVLDSNMSITVTYGDRH